MRTSQLILLSVVATSFLAGCGSSGGESASSSTSTVSGQFVDSYVSGLNYECSSGSNSITDLFGAFTCLEGDTISFNIMGYPIGSSLVVKTMTPYTLHPNDTQAAINVAQLLQTLDSDNNVQNGITLDSNDPAVQALSSSSIKIDQSDFDSAIVSYIGVELISEEIAIAHLDESITNIENADGGLTLLSTVIIMNGLTQEFCSSLQDSQDSTFDGFSDYADFIAQGGSQAVNYYSSFQNCDTYSEAGYCEVQDFSAQFSGTGSCVQAITFPFVPGGNENDDDDMDSSDEIGMTYNEYASIYKPMMPNLRNNNIYFSGNAYSSDNIIEAQYQVMDAKIKSSETLYFVGGNPLYGYEVYTDIYTTTTLSTQFYDSQSNALSNEGDWNIDIVNNVHTKQGEVRHTKFSEILATNTLHDIYAEVGLNIEFNEMDKAQFMITSNGNDVVYAYVTLAMNESAYLKVVGAFANYVVPVD